MRRRPQIFLANGNGTLNAFAAQATGHDYVVLANELFVNLYNGNRDGLRFILGHEINQPATEGSNGISFQGRRIEGVCFDT